MSRWIAEGNLDRVGCSPALASAASLYALNNRLLGTSGREPRAPALGRILVRVLQACRRGFGSLARVQRANRAAPAVKVVTKKLRIIALTNLGATAAFDPAAESMDFGRPLLEGEQLLACVVQLVEQGWPLPVETLALRPESFGAALQKLDWIKSAAVADREGLQHALPAELRCLTSKPLPLRASIECRYACSCGSQWRLSRERAEEERCPVCFTPCFPSVSVRVAGQG